MSKGIIVVDKIPQTCQHIRGNKEEGCPFGGMVCQITQNDVYPHVRDGSKPDWCPIRPIPVQPPLNMALTPILEDSWNACIEEILGNETR